MPEIKRKTEAHEPELKRKCRLGVNVFDLELLPEDVWVKALKGRVALDKRLLEPVDKNRDDEVAAVFTCPVLEAAHALDTLLSERRALNEELVKEELLRCYIHRGTAWVKLRRDVVLTLWDEGVGWTLNPDVFPVVEEPVRPSDISAPVPTFRLFNFKRIRK